MQPGHFEPSPLPVPAPLWFSGELPLEAGQQPFTLDQVLVVWVPIPSGGNDQLLDSNVETNCKTSLDESYYP